MVHLVRLRPNFKRNGAHLALLATIRYGRMIALLVAALVSLPQLIRLAAAQTHAKDAGDQRPPANSQASASSPAPVGMSAIDQARLARAQQALRERNVGEAKSIASPLFDAYPDT